MHQHLIHITSFIVLTQQRYAAAVADAISERAFFKITQRDLAQGKLILTAECDNLSGIELETNSLRDLEGVQAVTLVYHQAATLEELQEPIL